MNVLIECYASQVAAEKMGISAGYAATEKAASEKVGKVDWKSLTGGDKIAEIRKQFVAIGSAEGKEATSVQLKSSIAAKIDMVQGEVCQHFCCKQNSFSRLVLYNLTQVI